MTKTPSSPATVIAERAVALAIATTGHGLYLGYRYLHDGHVNPISLAALVFLAVSTALVAVWAFVARRQDERY